VGEEGTQGGEGGGNRQGDLLELGRGGRISQGIKNLGLTVHPSETEGGEKEGGDSGERRTWEKGGGQRERGLWKSTPQTKGKDEEGGIGVIPET
jgi:hypothetical protein